MHGTTVDVLPALIGLFAVLVGASIAAGTATRREQLARREQSQREALHGLQRACLAHRRALLAFSAVQATGPLEASAAADRVDETGQDIDLLEARILSDGVLERVGDWRRVVKSALLQDDKQRVTAAEEDSAWGALQDAVKQELRRLSSSRLWRERPPR